MPADDYLRTAQVDPGRILGGIDALAERVWGGASDRWGGKLRRFRAISARALDIAGEARGLDDDALARAAADLRLGIRCGRAAAADGARIFALLAEAARRRLQLDPFPEQIMAAAALGDGQGVEMATGEGKTLAIALAAVPMGWRREPCHVITANDYLARRDAAQLAPFYRFCGVNTAAVTSDMRPAERRIAYRADVVYITARELLADVLRDRLALGEWTDAGRRAVAAVLRGGRFPSERMITRGIASAIVDEADSLLIDEAATPLIISRQRENASLVEAVRTARGAAMNLREGNDYGVDFERRRVRLTEAGRNAAAAAAVEAGTIGRARWMSDLVEQALLAEQFFHRGQQYVVEDRKVVIVDEYTGRLMPGRTWKLGLHQAIEAKEGLPLTHPSETLARLSTQRFFRTFRRLAAISGTLHETAAELRNVYRLPLVGIPLHRPCRRRRLPDAVFASEEEKWAAIADEIECLHRDGRPVLAGTRSVRASEALASMLAARGIRCRLLNAVRSHEEAAIIAQAGQPGAVTIATNMAGRGTDITLGDGAAEAGGLHVIATERHEARRIDRQLFGRAGRQGDPGSARAFFSLEDELAERFLPPPVHRAASQAVRRSAPGSKWLARLMAAIAQRRAERQSRRQRAAVAQQDVWLDESLGRDKF